MSLVFTLFNNFLLHLIKLFLSHFLSVAFKETNEQRQAGLNMKINIFPNNILKHVKHAVF